VIGSENSQYVVFLIQIDVVDEAERMRRENWKKRIGK
jgi:hypothetical protein